MISISDEGLLFIMNAKGQNGYENFCWQEKLDFCGGLRMKKPIIQDLTLRYFQGSFPAISYAVMRGKKIAEETGLQIMKELLNN